MANQTSQSPAAALFGPAWCLECGNAYRPTRGTTQFCSADCRKTHHNRRVMGGLKLYDLAMKWRIERPTKAWYDLTQMADQLAAEEREIRKKRRENIASQRTAQKNKKAVSYDPSDFAGFSPEQVEAGLTTITITTT